MRGALERGDQTRESAPGSKLKDVLSAALALAVRSQKAVGVQLEESRQRDGGRVEDMA